MWREFLFTASTQRWGLKETVRTGRQFTRRSSMGESMSSLTPKLHFLTHLKPIIKGSRVCVCTGHLCSTDRSTELGVLLIQIFMV